MKTSKLRSIFLLLLIACLAGPGCRNVYYSTMEQFGQHKRDILVRRVNAARDSQETAKDQFQSALERFSEVTGFTGGNLRRQFDRLETEFRRCEDRAAEVSARIAAVEEVAEDLFKEWRAELGQYTDRSLRQRSEQQLRQTRVRYEQLMVSMRQAEARMDPVLNAFRDRVLFLKHNLNAQAIAALDDTAADLQRDIDVLVQEMERAISEANAFIEAMRAPTGSANAIGG